MTINLRKIFLIWGFVLFLSGIASGRPNTKICLRRNGKYPKPGTSCKGYYDCKNFLPVEKTCVEGEHFNANRQVCDWEDLYPCLEKKMDRECEKYNGLFLKSGTNCKKYYRCCNGQAKLEICAGDLLFDPSRGVCEWPDLYTCIESSTTVKVSSTVTTFATSTPSDDENDKSSTESPVSTSTAQKTTTSRRITHSTHDPDLERTSSAVLEISTRINTQTTANKISTTATSETSTLEPITRMKTSTLEPTSTIETSTLEPTTRIETSTLEPTTRIKTSTLEPTTRIETSTLKPTTRIETSTLEPTTTIETSTLQPTTSEIPKTSQKTSPPMSSTYSTHHTIDKEDREGDITEPTIFETSTEESISPSTGEITTSGESYLWCPEPNGNYPHPTNKHKFVTCSNNIPSIFDCPSNLVYKHRLKRCDYE